MGELNFCTLADIFKTAFTQLSAGLTVNRDVPLWIIRLFHNKLFHFTYASLRCYILYFDLSQLSRYVPRIIIPFVGHALWERRLRKTLWAIQILFPFIFIFSLGHFTLASRIYIFSGYYSFLGVLGLIKLLTRNDSKKLS